MSDGYLISTDGGLDLLSDEEVEALTKKARTIPDFEETVYLLNRDGREIYQVEVYAKGKDFFIPKGVEEWKPEFQKLKFSDLGRTWFFTLDDAKDEMYYHITDEEEIYDWGDGVWGVEKL